MSTSSIEDKIKIASAFLLASPPGEVNDVFNDVRTLINDDEGLQEGILLALEQYNTEQHVTVTLPDADYETVISKHGRIEGDRYIDPRSKKSFKFDHMRLAASEVEDYDNEDENEELRAIIEKEAVKYITDHYPFGACSVYCNDGDINIAVVGNKYNPKNFWNGRWLASWNYNTESRVLKGTTKVHVHYYEDGNVQLNTSKTHETTVAQESTTEHQALAIVKQMIQFDRQYHTSLNDSYTELAENTFKELRRTLPLTRNKLDWNKIMNYKIGNELSHK